MLFYHTQQILNKQADIDTENGDDDPEFEDIN